MLFRSLLSISVLAISCSTVTNIAHEELESSVIINKYKNALPILKASNESITDNILDFLSEFRDGSILQNNFRDIYSIKISEKITNQELLNFAIIGFSCKSLNLQNKVVSDVFDLGDYLWPDYFTAYIGGNIKNLYTWMYNYNYKYRAC
jgi:hypothetical protein